MLLDLLPLLRPSRESRARADGCIAFDHALYPDNPMNLDFSAFDKALNQLGQSIIDNSQAARSHLSQLADLQAKLDALKIDVKAKADALRAEGAATNAYR